MTEVQLLEVDQRFQALYPGEPIRLDREDLQRVKCRQVLL